jgi:hypothetical protein
VKVSPRKFILIAVALALTVSIAFREPILRSFGHVLVVDDPVGSTKADVIVVPAWTQAAGALEAADLVHAGVAPRVAVLIDAPDRTDVELVRRKVMSTATTSWLTNLLKELQVEEVETIADSGDGTSEESAMLPALCDQHGWRTVIVVSLPDHSRRLHRLLRRSMNGRPTRILVRTARYAPFDPNTWWRSRGGIRIGLQESQKLLLDFMLHPLS